MTEPTHQAEIVADSLTMLVTGANGFVGTTACRTALNAGWSVRGTCREGGLLPDGVVTHLLDLEDEPGKWYSVLNGVDVVVHTAARVHVMREQGSIGAVAFRDVNVSGTIKVAEQAAKAGVRRFVFISTVKVNGESTAEGFPFTPEDPSNPQDAYSISKLEAEQALLSLAMTTSMEIVIIRPPLIYGKGVKANFAEMISWLRRGIPLPFGAIKNKRSLVAIDTLVDFILICAVHPAAKGQIFLVSDGHDLSTTELMSGMATAMGIPVRLIPIPEKILIAAANIFGKGALAMRLCGSLQVDISKNKRLLGWVPSISMNEAFRRVLE